MLEQAQHVTFDFCGPKVWTLILMILDIAVSLWMQMNTHGIMVEMIIVS